MDIASSYLILILLWGQTKDVRFQNVSFKYDTSLTAAVTTRHVPAEAIEGPDWEGPAHLSFALLNSYADTQRPPSYQKTPEFRVYRVRDFHKMLPETRATLAKLRSFLTGNQLDTWQGEIPYLPQYAAIEYFHSRVKLIESSGVSGVRFLTVYAQDTVEISNQRLEYVFSGLSKDGKLYLVAHFPVFVSTQQSDEWERAFKRLLNRDLTDESPEYRTYLKSVIDSLEKREDTAFQPDLAKLDQLLQSVDVSQARF